MNALYAESSGILAWLFGEGPGSTVRDLLERVPTIATSFLSILECERATVRAVVAGRIQETARRRMTALLRRTIKDWHILDVPVAVQQRIGLRFPVEPVRTIDAIHLATAVHLRELFPDIAMLTFDQRVIANARALGLPLALDVDL